MLRKREGKINTCVCFVHEIRLYLMDWKDLKMRKRHCEKGGLIEQCG